MSGFWPSPFISLLLILLLTTNITMIACHDYRDSNLKGHVTINRDHNIRSIFGTQLQNVTIGGSHSLIFQKLDDDTILIFGGYGYSSTTTIGLLNDVWMYQMSTNRWTWLTGSKSVNVLASYDTEPLFPGGRTDMLSWLSNGDLIMFGGSESNDWLNDLWRYTLSTNTWAFIGGSKTKRDPGLFGAKGNSSVDFLPPSRHSAVSWTTQNGDLWLFGGSSPLVATRSDLWRYRPSTLEWTWMSGSDQSDHRGEYGTQNQESGDNFPGARKDSTAWTDAQGNLWLFGGIGLPITSYGLMNNLWRYRPSNNRWTWMKGTFYPDQPGQYGTRNISSSANDPPARQWAISAVDPNGDDLWLFGGRGVNGYYNDLWRYRISTNEWTWMSGSQSINIPGVYGTQGVPATGNYPGSRQTGTMWCDLNGDVWLIGSFGYAELTYGHLNDIWRYRPSTDEWAWIGGSKTPNALAVNDQCQGVDDGTVCDDYNACTLGDTCQSGVCTFETGCTPSSICVVSTCDASLGCIESPNPANQNDPQCLPPVAPVAAPMNTNGPVSNTPVDTMPIRAPKDRISGSPSLLTVIAGYSIVAAVLFIFGI